MIDIIAQHPVDHVNPVVNFCCSVGILNESERLFALLHYRLLDDVNLFGAPQIFQHCVELTTNI